MPTLHPLAQPGSLIYEYGLPIPFIRIILDGTTDLPPASTSKIISVIYPNLILEASLLYILSCAVVSSFHTQKQNPNK